MLRVEEFLPCPADRVWRALTDPDLIARWLMPNDFRLEAGHRFAIGSDPIRQCGLGGTGHCEVLAFDEGNDAADRLGGGCESMSGLDSAVTFTVAPEEAGTRLLIEHDGLHPCPYAVTEHRVRAGRRPLLHPAHRRGARHGRRLARCHPARLGGAFPAMPPAGKAEGTGIRLTAMPDRCGGRGGRLDQAGGAISVSRPRRPAMQKIVADSTGGRAGHDRNALALPERGDTVGHVVGGAPGGGDLRHPRLLAADGHRQRFEAGLGVHGRHAGAQRAVNLGDQGFGTPRPPEPRAPRWP